MVKRPILLAVFLLVTFLTSLSAHAGLFDSKLKWRTISTKNFNIHYYEGEEEIAHRMAFIAEKVHATLSPRWKWKPWGRTEIILTDTTDVSNAFTSTLPYNFMLLFITAPTADSTLAYYNDWLEDLFMHEYTHTLTLDMYGGIAKPFRWVLGRIITPNGLTPGWVREGIAVQQESLGGKGRANSSFSEMMLRTDILNDQFLAIDQMAGLQFDWPSFNAAYIYGGMFWTYLGDTYGQDKLVEWFHRYSNSMWLFSLNNKARKTWNDKNFLMLRREWKAYLTEKYNKQKAEVEAKGLTNLTEIKHIKGNLDNPTVSRDGKKIIYSKSDVHSKSEIRMMNVDGSGDERLYVGRTGNQYSFSPDGKKVAFSSMGTYKGYYQFWDVYTLDLETKKLGRVTKGLRAFHPDYSPDGKQLVFVVNKLASTQLYLWDKETKKAKVLTEEPGFVQFSNPRFSPDGKTIAVSLWKDGNRDIYLYDLQGKVVKQVTNDKAVDMTPAFSPDGADLFYTSDVTGITNVWRYNFASGQTEQVSNVLTGLFNPQFNGQTMVTQNYFGRGYDIRSYAYTPAPLQAPPPVAKAKTKKGKQAKAPRLTKRQADDAATAQLDAPKGSVPPPAAAAETYVEPAAKLKAAPPAKESAVSAGETAAPDQGVDVAKAPDGSAAAPVAEDNFDPSVVGDLKSKKYNPFKKLFIPRYIIPNIFFGDSVTITADIGSADPLGWHRWTGGINYRFDANHLGGQFLYSYNRFWPQVFVNYFNFVVDYGDIFGNGESFFETRNRANAGVTLAAGMHALSAYYFFEHRSADSAIPPGVILPPTLGNFSGFGLRYTLTRVNYFPASISLEGGPRLTVSIEGNPAQLGSSSTNEQLIISGDLREYVPLPMQGHVLAFRVAGGIAFGDRLLQGTFRLGSALGEGTLAAITPRLYTLRGLPQITFAGERAMLFSGEYRLPLVAPQRGLSTGPIQINKIYMNFFADYGSVFNGSLDFNNFLLGVGAEIRGDFILGYGLPLTARLGYGIIVSGREFIQGLKDPVLGTAITNGTLILELGTSF